MSGSMASLALTMYSSSSSAEPCTNWMPGSSSRRTGPCGSARSQSRFSGVSWSRVQSVARPATGLKSSRCHEAADGFVVIAADEDVSQSLRAGNDLVGIAAVADRVAKIHHEVVRGSGGEAGFERFEIAVNVAEQKDAHEGGL